MQTIHKLKNKVAGNPKPFLVQNNDNRTKIVCNTNEENITVTEKWSLVTCKKCLERRN